MSALNNLYKSFIKFIKRRIQSSESLQLELLNKSKFFDANWYLSEYPDVKESGIHPAKHYLLFGHAEGRSPGPNFDDEFYRSQIKQKIAIPLLHYEKKGKFIGLSPKRTFTSTIWWNELTDIQFFQSPETVSIDVPYRKNVYVILPIYNGFTYVRDCIASIERNRSVFHVILVDDASDEPELTIMLDSYAKRPNFTLIRHKSNQGFTKSVNNGLRKAKNGDVLLLNSDTIVPIDLILSLKRSAYSDNSLATVTPMSNDAGPFSLIDADLFSESTKMQLFVDGISRLLKQAKICKPIRIPTGHGFCLFIKESAIKQIGSLNADLFPRGYGEENDFCFKLNALGFHHAIDACTFVYHQAGSSFGEEKKRLITSGLKQLNTIHEGYDDVIRKGFSSKDFKSLTRAMRSLSKSIPELIEKSKPRVLFTIATENGGTAKTNKDLMNALSNKYETFVLKSNSRRVNLYYFLNDEEVLLEESYLSNHIEPFNHSSNEYDDIVLNWLVRWNIELIHVRQIAWHSLTLIGKARAASIPAIFSFHDFYSVCPSVKLLDNNQKFCGGSCTSGKGKCSTELWPSKFFVNLKHKDIFIWQSFMQEMLSHFTSYVTTSQFAKDLILSNFKIDSKKAFDVIHHGRDFDSFKSFSRAPSNLEPIKLLMLGTITASKGGDYVIPLLDQFHNIEIHVVGDLPSTTTKHPRLHIYGKYKRELLSEKIAHIKPSWGLILSTWPETWCHTLTELWSCGLPVIAIPNGAIKERIEHNRCGILADGSSFQAVARSLKTGLNVATWETYRNNVLNWQFTEGAQQNTSWMAKNYEKIYEKILLTRS